MKYRGGIRLVATQDTRPFINDFSIPGVDDTGNYGVIVAEGDSMGDRSTTSFRRRFAFSKISSRWFKVSLEYLQGTRIPAFGAWVMNACADRVGASVNSLATAYPGFGAAARGIGTPNGAAANVGDVANTKIIGISAAAGVTSTTANTAAPTKVDIDNWWDSLDPAYETGLDAMMMLNKASITRLRGIQSNGLYVYNFMRNSNLTGTQVGTPNASRYMNDTPYVLNNEVASAVTTGQIVGLYGRLSEYHIYDVPAIGIQSFFDSNTADTGEVWFLTASYHAMNLRDTNAVSRLVTK